jgi:CubicO group peptidase (beta-lactamase class C family)
MTNRNRWFVVLLAILLVSSSIVSAQPAPLANFDDYVARAVRDWEVPGLAVTVVKDGQVVFAKGYGVRELGGSEPVDTHTLFAIGSTTKAMVAASVGLLVDEGKLGWDDPVTKHLPDFQLYDPYVSREVTVRDLLTHRAGLGNADFLWYGQDATRRDILYRLRYLPPQTSMRSHFTYQNIMYTAAGEVVAAAGDASWERFLRQRIFEPLGMEESVALLAETEGRPNVASPHDRIDGEVRAIQNASVDPVAPAGSVWSSVNDMAKWMLFLLEGKPTLLEAETRAELFKPQFIVDGSFYPTTRLTHPHWTTYGLGWFQQDYNGRAIDFHTGSIDGMVAIIGLIRDERLGVYVLGNLDHAEVRHALMYRVFDLYGDAPPRDWSAELTELYGELRREAELSQKELEEERVAGTSPSFPLEDYVGTYSDPLYGTIKVTYDGKLTLRYGPGLAGELEHWHYDTFLTHWEAKWRGRALVIFNMDAVGRVATLNFGARIFEREATEESSEDNRR